MREILFSGKRVDNGKEVIGFYFNVPEHHNPDLSGKSIIISINNGLYFEVVPETVGQFTGLTDKNGKKLFEGDKVISEYGTIGIVEWDNEECSFLVNIGDDYQMLTDSEYVVIGNIYDNFELLEEYK